MKFNRTVLVTGGSGFIGSHLVCSLVDSHPDWRIINLDYFADLMSTNFSDSKQRRSLCRSELDLLHLSRNIQLDYCCSPRSLESVEDRDNYTFIRGDVCNPRLVNHIFNTERIDAIFHLAAKTHVESSFRFPSGFQRVNVDGTRVLLEAAHQARHQPRRFIYVSTDEVYGAGVDQIFDESSPLRPSNPYSVTKAAAELLVTSYWDAYKFPVIITRSNNIYGPRQYTEKVIPRFLSLLQMNRKCTIQGTLPISRHFLFVDDAVKAFLLLLDKGTAGEIYNVGTACEVPILQLAKELVKMVKNVPDSEVTDWLEFVSDRPLVDLRYPIRCEKLQQLGWTAQVSWAEGIRQTVKWYQDNPDFWADTSKDRGPIRYKPEDTADPEGSVDHLTGQSCPQRCENLQLMLSN